MILRNLVSQLYISGEKRYNDSYDHHTERNGGQHEAHDILQRIGHHQQSH